MPRRKTRQIDRRALYSFGRERKATIIIICKSGFGFEALSVLTWRLLYFVIVKHTLSGLPGGVGTSEAQPETTNINQQRRASRKAGVNQANRSQRRLRTGHVFPLLTMCLPSTHRGLKEHVVMSPPKTTAEIGGGEFLSCRHNKFSTKSFRQGFRGISFLIFQPLPITRKDLVSRLFGRNWWLWGVKICLIDSADQPAWRSYQPLCFAWNTRTNLEK